ncbi:hypothetical protein Trydic_g5945 [Trypoxylus dichotomus]
MTPIQINRNYVDIDTSKDMGNVKSIKTSHRTTVSKLLIHIPAAFFGPTPRILINKNLIEWKTTLEVVNDIENEEWDSALEISCDSESVTSDNTYSPKRMRQRRLSYCCTRSVAKEELIALQEELKALRAQVTELLSRNAHEEFPAKCEIPTPPPFPSIFPDQFASQAYCSTPKSDRMEMLKDITNVRLKPIDTTVTKELGRSPDVRHDLHEILKRRYAAMHSPCPRRFRVNESDEENRLVYRSDGIIAC